MVTGGVVGLGVGVGLVGGDEVALPVGLGLGLDVEPETVLLDAVGLADAVEPVDVVGLGDAVAVSATTAALMGSNESACVRNWSRASRVWAAVT